MPPLMSRMVVEREEEEGGGSNRVVDEALDDWGVEGLGGDVWRNWWV